MHCVPYISTISPEQNPESKFIKKSGYKEKMSSPKELAQKDKEAIGAALASGEMLPHLFKLPHFQLKKLKGVKKNHVVPGSTV